MTGPTQAVVQFQTKITQASISRPADTNQYAAGDVVAGAASEHLVFIECFRKGKGPVAGDAYSGSINTARCFSSANQGTKPDLELWLFYDDIVQVGDNAAFAPSDAELLKCVGVIDFATGNWRVGTSTGGADGNAMCETNNIGLTLRGNKSTLYGVLVERGTYTPVAAETFTVQLAVTQD